MCLCTSHILSSPNKFQNYLNLHSIKNICKISIILKITNKAVTLITLLRSAVWRKRIIEELPLLKALIHEEVYPRKWIKVGAIASKKVTFALHYCQ